MIAAIAAIADILSRGFCLFGALYAVSQDRLDWATLLAVSYVALVADNMARQQRTEAALARIRGN